MEKKRLFIATFIDKKIFETKYSSVIEEFSTCCTGKWVEHENLHFTYYFLGDVEDNKIPVLMEDLKFFLKTYNAPLYVNALGCFPSPARPKVLYADIFNPDKTVFFTQRKIERTLERHGFLPEKRKYEPHVTLLRVKSSEQQFKDVIMKYRRYDFGKMYKFRINLVESQLTNQGPIYTILG
ncbi:MAG: 2,3-cyclic 3-phosphodiesterase [Bacteroidota bacterium]|nr:2,3-cyclic 3-phosphodiesterase [Bacteroidota bacterium]